MQPEMIQPEPLPDEEWTGAAENDADLPAERVTYQTLRRDEEVLSLIRMADQYLDTIGYTDHGLKHLARVSQRAYRLVKDLGLTQREAELAAIAGLLHDIGNLIHRDEHPQSSALMAIPLLTARGMTLSEVGVIAGAIANHDESNGEPISNVCAALILGDKSDVLRTRVRNPAMIGFDIHDRVNWAATATRMTASREQHRISLYLEIDTRICQVMEYFEIFLSRMHMSRKAAHYLNCEFELIINDTQML